MTWLKTLFQFWMVVREGKFVGDAVILKAACFGGLEPGDAARHVLESLPKHPPDFSQYDYSKFAPGTLGSEYLLFMKKHRLKAFAFSGQYQALLEKHFFTVWYASVHDLIHVLTGFDTTWAGEGGVWGFVAGQNLSPFGPRAIKLARVFYPIFNRGGKRDIQLSIQRGLTMGANANSILGLNFHEELANPVAEIRQRFGVSVIPQPKDEAMNQSVFKILTEPEWTDFKERGDFIGTPADIRDGFIHLSSKEQVDGVILRYYAKQRPLYVVEFSAKELGNTLRWESANDGQKFPHLYGRSLRLKEVVQVQVEN